MTFIHDLGTSSLFIFHSLHLSQVSNQQKIYPDGNDSSFLKLAKFFISLHSSNFVELESNSLHLSYLISLCLSKTILLESTHNIWLCFHKAETSSGQAPNHVRLSL